MKQQEIVDKAKSIQRKIHDEDKPLGGGAAIYLSFFIPTAIAFYLSDIGTTINGGYLLAIATSGAIIVLGGLLDDIYNLKYYWQFIAPVLAVVIIIFFGIGPEVITNPFGGVFRLNNLVLSFGSVKWVLLSDIIVFFWLMGMMFTTKLLDGLDGLVAGLVAIGGLMIFFLSLQPQWYQPEMSVISIIFAASCLGFLFWNWHPASIFLGESGSLLVGFILGTLAIISGGKIATALLVMGIPILDVVRVVFMRVKKGKSVFRGDKEHLHFRLISNGLNQRQAVLLFYAISFLFGITTLFLQSKQKLIALLFLAVLMLLVGIWFLKQDSNNTST
ncbi:MAG: MraY family glycosyltransferase [Candidatus Magasanikbacteria bacterium]